MARCTLRLMKKTRNISSLHLEHKRFAFHLYAPSSKVCESLHFFASCMLGEAVWDMQICDTTCHAMITRKHVAMETAITIVRRHISVTFLEQSRQQIVTNLETDQDHYTENRRGKLWRYKCLIHISRHRVSCLSFRWESWKFLYLSAMVTMDRTDYS